MTVMAAVMMQPADRRIMIHSKVVASLMKCRENGYLASTAHVFLGRVSFSLIQLIQVM